MEPDHQNAPGSSQLTPSSRCDHWSQRSMNPHHEVLQSVFPKYCFKMLFSFQRALTMFCFMEEKKKGNYLETPKHISGELHKPVETTRCQGCEGFCQRMNSLTFHPSSWREEAGRKQNGSHGSLLSRQPTWPSQGARQGEPFLSF